MQLQADKCYEGDAQREPGAAGASGARPWLLARASPAHTLSTQRRPHRTAATPRPSRRRASWTLGDLGDHMQSFQASSFKEELDEPKTG